MKENNESEFSREQNIDNKINNNNSWLSYMNQLMNQLYNN